MIRRSEERRKKSEITNLEMHKNVGMAILPKSHYDVIEFMDALRYGEIDVCEKLLKEGAIIIKEDANGVTWLHNVLSYEKSKQEYDPELTPIKSIKYLIEEKEIPSDGRDCYGMTPLTYAMISKNYEVAKYLLEKGANPNNADLRGENIPFWNATNEPLKKDLVIFFLEHGGDLYKEVKNGQSLLKNTRSIYESREDTEGKEMLNFLEECAQKYPKK